MTTSPPELLSLKILDLGDRVIACDEPGGLEELLAQYDEAMVAWLKSDIRNDPHAQRVKAIHERVVMRAVAFKNNTESALKKLKKHGKGILKYVQAEASDIQRAQRKKV